jgi:eukaryotic-like serine/threonine-protein kinase
MSPWGKSPAGGGAVNQNELHVGGRVLGRYRVVQPLGSGGMGVVYLGRTEGAAGFTRPVVIKRLRASLAGEREHNEMFAREARILSNLQHPNIVSVVDFGREGGEYVMVLEYVHGYDLDQWSSYVWRGGRQHSADHVLFIARKVLAALHYAHSLRRPDGAPANIVHRDVSLSNVLLDAQGMVKLHDFGIARMEGGSEAPTETGVFKGKLGLAAPELLSGDRATPRSDIYSLGVMTYQLLSGVNPFRGKDAANTMFRVLQHTPPLLAAARDDLPEGLDEVLGRALHKEPEQRFDDASQFAHALAELCERSDEDVVEDMARTLATDFERIPLASELDSLSTRDAAWRDAQVSSEAAPLPLSSSPPRPAPEPGSALISTLPPARPVAAGIAPVSFGPTQTPSAAARAMRAVPRFRRPALAAAALVLIGATGIWLATRPPADPSTRYVVIQKPSDPPPAAPAPATAFVASPPSEPAPAPVPGSGGTGGAGVRPPALHNPKPPASRPDAATLTREFKRHRPRVEACIHRHVDQIDRHPQISVRFEVNTAGKVTSAELSPPALAGTPLGTCILGVARSVPFSPVSKAVAFSIPITARRTP